ncbi:MAG: NupC/NupG family nucleoside CNT transporter [Roseibacillus sp.]|jgi:CNT family concentrative nucleoside transporter|nr:NupC/NupG family nucleoside CNT transporter [Roseibacillus sp.]MBP36400.1 NupC/NupG family nucleoside CNT transporter [Roseibacillus sp.]MCP4729965.1 NupC/NupG family nucleoside CNT transporter [Roseibacillus sp.]MDP7306808.1 NupC/NupG family nucleoside CNT transporter [Roseibacillus sp.]MDP7495960.1 NupC/NupG family nucleoside CNT transporter [Roseibacillus sp.]|tara:strand:- start:24476 stop:25696 length:1221 start_codon:yes stop_codon:yes gene_type:complete
MSALVSLLGMAALLGIAVLASSNRRAIRLRSVLGAFLVQVGLGAFVLFTPWGQAVLGALSKLVQAIIVSGDKGITFLFGPLAEQDSMGFIFVVRVLPVIIFFASLIAVLYHLGIMPLIIRTLGGALRKALGTSRAESLSATANIFVGQTEAPLVVRPYIPRMTQSELFAIMVGGLASIAGSVLAAYAGMGVKLEYLLAASFMAAPGGLLFAKILLPESEVPEEHLPEDEEEDKPVNVFDAAAQGASAGLKLALNVGAMLLAFIALIALFNLGLGTVGGWFGHSDLTLQQILGVIFAPLAWILGVPWEEARQAGSFIGQKIVLNEFVAYKALLDDGSLSQLSEGIVTFALCGFANLSSIAILLGGLGGMAPTRRRDIARLGLKAVFAASLANFMSAAIAGLFLALSL